MKTARELVEFLSTPPLKQSLDTFLVRACDEDMQKHDDKYHGGHYEEGERCEKRETMKKENKGEELDILKDGKEERDDQRIEAIKLIKNVFTEVGLGPDQGQPRMFTGNGEERIEAVASAIRSGDKEALQSALKKEREIAEKKYDFYVKRGDIVP